LTAPQIAFNGGLIFDPVTGAILVQHALTVAASVQLLTLIERVFPTVSVSVYDRTTWYTQRVDAGILHEQSLTHQSPVVVHQSLAELAQSRQLMKIMLIVSVPAVRLELAHQLTALGLPVNIQQSGKAYLEITSQRALKSQGVAYLLAQRQLDAMDAAAFGDGHNDLSMLQAVGTPVVMGNATVEIQGAGRYVTQTNDEDGVMFGMRHYLKLVD